VCLVLALGATFHLLLVDLGRIDIFALSIGMLFADASVVAHTGYYCPPETTAKGNNGWGQEKNKGTTDGTNNGSDDGATADAKTASTER
jgi:hypothetical protein